MHLSARETGLTGTKSGESVEDGAERGGGGRHRERSMHASLDQAVFFIGQSGIMGRVQGYYSLISDLAKLRYIHGAAVAKIGYISISAFATRPGRHLIDLVDRF